MFSFRNDGEGLSENNVKVNWENDNQVSITFLTYTSQEEEYVQGIVTIDILDESKNSSFHY